MGKLFESSSYVVEMAEQLFSDAGLENFITLNVISTTKGKEIIKVIKASPETEFLTKKDDMITLVIYEEAFEQFEEEQQRKIMESYISCISYDSEKEKILIDKSELNMINRMRHKYDNSILDILESASEAIKQLDEKVKEKKK